MFQNFVMFVHLQQKRDRKLFLKIFRLPNEFLIKQFEDFVHKGYAPLIIQY